MKKFIFPVAILFGCYLSAPAHPLHVSVTNITLEGNMLNITINTFVDDWETAYFHYYGKPIHLKTAGNTGSEWFREYLQASFSIRMAGDEEALELVRDTITFEDMSMHLEMHVNLMDNPKTLYIYNAILTDIFADQTNLLIFSAGGKQKGIKFDYNKREEELKLRL
jgi:hypothetical protein